MLTPSDIGLGIVLRVINAHGIGAPLGSLATVKAIETSRSGDWVCIVEYQQKKAPRQGTRLYRSHLWISDLNRFEIVKDEPAKSSLKAETRAAGQSTTRIQLALPFPSEPDYIKTFTT
jgi:hypothetical protein